MAMRQGVAPRLTGVLMRGVARRMARHAAPSSIAEVPPLALAIRQAREILIVALAEAGDMVLLSPFLRELRRAVPGARITLVTMQSGAILLGRSPVVDQIRIFPTAVSRLLRPLLLPRRARRFAREELGSGFDVAIVPRWDTDHHLATAVALYSGAARRVGFTEHSTARRSTLNAGFDALLTDVIESAGTAHEVERHLALLRALGVEPQSSRLQSWLTDDDRQRAAELLPPPSNDQMLVAFGIGAAHPKRRWPAARFAEVARILEREHRARVVVVGGPDDIAAQQEILRVLPRNATGLAGRLTFRETAAALAHCALFIGNDSAPMHLAAAAGVPCVEISCHPLTGDPAHNNAPERFGPWGVANTVLRPPRPVPPCDDGCRAAGPHCILEVTAEAVIGAAAALLTEQDRTSTATELRGTP